MRAYNLAMFLIFINCGVMITAALGAFGDMNEYSAGVDTLNTLANPVFKVGGVSITGIQSIALLMLGATAVVPIIRGKFFSAEGVAYVVFIIVFWGSFATTTLIFTPMVNRFPGLAIFVGIFGIASALIFVIALVQMPTGGQKTHV